MDNLIELWNEFRRVWPIERVRKMTLQEYTQAQNKETFTYWLESKLDILGSIWGGSALKFGVYSRGNLETKENKSGRMYSGSYGWLEKYGNTVEEAFENVKKCILDVIVAVQQNDLAKIDQIDLGAAYKWKIAFHFQPSINDPICVNIFKPRALEVISGMNQGTSISVMQRTIIAKRNGMNVFDYASKLWKEYQNDTVEETVIVSKQEKSNINSIYYGPPGTGKTFWVLQLMKNLEAKEEGGGKVSIHESKELEDTSTFWHLAPGQNGYLWNQLKESSKVGYEWCNKDLGDLSKLSPTSDHYDIRHRFSYVKAGDYFAFISGKNLLGLARALQAYDYNRAQENQFDFQTIDVEWLEHFSPPILLDSTSIPTFSKLNGGSRWEGFMRGLSGRGYVFKSNAIQSGKIKSSRKPYKWVTFHQSYSYEDFVQGIKPVLGVGEEEAGSRLDYEIQDGTFYQACDEAAQNAGFADLKAAIASTYEERRDRFATAPPYYLVIDEISRGNVANIFGELITLIEIDKRLGQENEIIVELPYSKSKFGVPPNLYIIGTMNTADRSVEALDVALRRRFSFIGLYPDPALIEQPEEFDVDLCKMLTAMNNRIETLLDKDHCLGHSYFMTIALAEDPLEELRQVFKNRIIPLLQEYFYANPSKIGMILGPEFVKEKQDLSQIKFFTQFDSEFETPDKKSFSFEYPTDTAAFRKIYES